MGMMASIQANVPVNRGGTANGNNNSNTNSGSSFRADCTQATSDTDLSINNVRARLLGGGDMWWDFSRGRYVVPKVEPGSGDQEISSIFAGAIWIGGYDDGGNLKMAAQTYRSASSNDFFSGPLDPVGGTEEEICNNWDKMFEVTGAIIEPHAILVRDKGADAVDCGSLSRELKGWPGKGNPHFAGIHGFELPFQDLAPFYDENGDGLYNPCDGDFPIIEIIGCEADAGEPGKVSYADQMVWYVFNDNGGIHTETTGDPIRMEIQTLAFAYQTGDQVNDMTFYRYKLVNRAPQSIDSTYFGQWVDADLGCHLDDYIGCDIDNQLMYIYNATATDGAGGCESTPSYGNDVPMLGVDYFRGPKDENGVELGMSSFVYYVNGGYPGLPNTGDPVTGQQYYNYLSGTWRDGTPYYATGNGYQQSGPTTSYVFPGEPDDAAGWSMCTQTLPGADLRTVQSSGPFRLDPGAINELIIGAVWTPDVLYPCPSMTKLLAADELSQALYDNCFKITDGPSAPDLDIVELDKKLVILLTNDSTSNNFQLNYAEKDLLAPADEVDSMYVFEGYKVYQLSSSNVSDLDDPDQARLILQTDLNNEVDALYNWEEFPGEVLDVPVFVPVEKVDGQNEGIQSSLVITSDQFSQQAPALVNHQKYYFVAVAYAFNEYEQFDPVNISGQRRVYLEGRKNVVVTTGIPRIPTPEFGGITLNSDYGDGAPITRLDGTGTGVNFLDLSDETRSEILENNCAATLVYKEGRGPVSVKVVDPLRVQPGTYQISILDTNTDDDILEVDSARWMLTTPAGEQWFSDQPLNVINEQIIAKKNEEGQTITLGISISLGQVEEPGTQALLATGETNGFLGAEEVYADGTAIPWYQGVGPTGTTPFLNYVPTGPTELYENRDNQQIYKGVLEGRWVPYTLTQCISPDGNTYFSPAWENSTFCGIVQSGNGLDKLRNVDIVLTSNKDLWSRCPVIETARDQITQNEGFTTEGGAENFELRAHNSVDKNGDDDNTGTTGMGWFPGYAIDVETGCRLNVFFGENSVYRADEPLLSILPNVGAMSGLNGADMLFNPTSDQFADLDGSGDFTGSFELPLGGQHYVYVSSTEYDEGEEIATRIGGASAAQKVQALRKVIWTSFPILPPGVEMASIQDGLIPNDLSIKLRVNNPYSVTDDGTPERGVNGGYPLYEFTLDGAAPDIANDETKETALDLINVVPNPYYAYSAYEQLNTTNTVKITNLPPECTVSIYSMDGKFIRQYDRAENSNSNIPDQGVLGEQMNASVDWDLKNARGIPIASGVYLIHVVAPGIGERTLKWFGVTRTFDTYRN